MNDWRRAEQRRRHFKLFVFLSLRAQTGDNINEKGY